MLVIGSVAMVPKGLQLQGFGRESEKLGAHLKPDQVYRPQRAQLSNLRDEPDIRNYALLVFQHVHGSFNVNSATTQICTALSQFYYFLK